jgi:CheY-like chemotaxis protein
VVKILIVDDNPMDRILAKRILQKDADWELYGGLQTFEAENGVDALEVAGRDHPDLVLTDLHMPKMDGLRLVEEIRLRHGLIPVVLITAHGSEDTAYTALRRGAANYVPKTLLANELTDTVLSVIDTMRAKRERSNLMRCLNATEAHFVLENDPALIPPLIAYLRDSRFMMAGGDETGLVRLTVALREAALNAMHHGNLELTSELRETNEKEYHRLCDERRHSEPYASRRVYVTVRDTPKESTYTIRDDGPGFDPTQLPDPLDPANMDRVSGRGLLLVRTFMDEVRHNAKGNEITMIKRNVA